MPCDPAEAGEGLLDFLQVVRSVLDEHCAVGIEVGNRVAECGVDVVEYGGELAVGVELERVDQPEVVWLAGRG